MTKRANSLLSAAGAFLLMAALPTAICAATYYISPAGSDANPGTSAQPWLTVQRSTKTATAGDTVILADGQYVGGIRIRKDGTAQAPLTYRAEHPRRAVINGVENEAYSNGIEIYGNHVVIDGLWVQNVPVGNGIVVAAASVAVKNCVSINNGWGIDANSFGGQGLLTSGDSANGAVLLDNEFAFNREHGLYVSAGTKNALVRRNSIHDNPTNLQVNAVGNALGSTGIRIEGNVFYNGGRGNLVLMNVQSARIVNNILYKSGNGPGISISIGSRNNLLYHNTIYHDADNTRPAIQINGYSNYGPSSGTVLLNNIMVVPSGSLASVPIAYYSASLPILSDYNVLRGAADGIVSLNQTTNESLTFAQWQALGLDRNSVHDDPQFASASGADFHLMVGSPAIDVAANVQVGADFDGNARSQGAGFDMGAYERLIGPAAPSVAFQPTDQIVAAGQTASFSLFAAGSSPLSYQWRKNSANIPGAVSSFYTTPPASLSDSGTIFDCVITNAYGTAVSSAATLTVHADIPPSITVQPKNATVNAGQQARVSVGVIGTKPLSFQWYKNGTAIAAATKALYVMPPVTLADDGSQFYCAVSNAAGMVTSSTGTLTVTQAGDPSITAQPESTATAVGQSATFVIVATGTPSLSYQWYKNGAFIVSAASSSYTTPAVTLLDSGASFYALVSNSNGSVFSSTAALTVTGAADVVPPAVAISSPVSGSTVSAIITISGTAYDNARVASVALSIDGGPYALAAGTAAWTYALDTTSLTNGSHTLTALATDPSANSSSATIALVVLNNRQGTTIIGPQGGTVTFNLNQSGVSAVIQLVFLPGTFDSPTSITLQSPTLPLSGQAPGPLWGAKQSGLGFEVLSGQQPKNGYPVLIKISNIRGVSMGQSCLLAWQDPKSSLWLPLSSRQDSANAELSATATHFTLFAVLQLSAATDFSSVKVYPNPLRPSLGHSGINFTNLPAGARIRIFTVLGEKLKELAADPSGMALWDGKNEAGRKVASGGYFALLEANGNKKIINLAVQK